jgi:hypothetical protein
MRLALARWKAHRALVDRAGVLRPFASRPGRRLLVISVGDAICHTQIFPFFFHAPDLARDHDLQVRELPLSRFEQERHPYVRCHVDAVAFQTWFDLGTDRMGALVHRIRQAWPEARLAYLDWFAPTDLRYAAVLADQVDVYVKKQVLRSRHQYNRETLGDTNLTDYYARRFDLSAPPTCFAVPDSFWDKLHVGTHFAFSDYMLPKFGGGFPDGRARSIDMHARMAVKGTEWYTLMRRQAFEAAQALERKYRVVSRGHVSRRRFLQEMLDAKLCFSPFGYGEVCWRDFEAMFAGSVLLKPDMSHILCQPDSYVPNQTYVPLAWDLSDLPEKVDHYLTHEAERADVAHAAFDGLHRYVIERRFLDDTAPMLQKLQLA